MRSRDVLPPKVLQIVGLLGMVGCAAIYGPSGAALVAAFGTLAVYGLSRDVKAALPDKEDEP